MSAFLESPVNWLLPSPNGRHRFGGPARHRGATPPGESHPIHLIYDLDFADTNLGLAPYYPKLKRLPLYIAFQYNCTDIVYHVVSDDEIELRSLHDPRTWERDFPHENYPLEFPLLKVESVPAPAEFVQLYQEWVLDDGDRNKYPDNQFTQEQHNASRIGGRFPMDQEIPEWDCTSAGCQYSKTESSEGKLVFCVVWERPVPGLDVWTLEPNEYNWGNTQIIFSLCTGCSAIHSCNRCT